MKWIKLIPLTLALAALTPGVRAQDKPDKQIDKSDEMWRKFHVKLYNIVAAGNENKKTVVAFLHGGTPLPDKVEVEDIYGFLDTPIKLLPDYTPIPGVQLFKAYKEQLLPSIVFDPAPKPTPKEQAELDKHVATLDPDAPGWLNYLKAQAAYAEALGARTAWQKEQLLAGKSASGTLPASFTNAINNTKAQYNRVKQPIEEAIRCVDQYAAKDPTTGMKILDDECVRGEFAESGLGMVRCFPPIPDWSAPTGWTKFSYKATDNYSKSTFSQTEWEASATLKVGAFSGEGSASYSNTLAAEISNDSSLEMTMEIKRIYFTRPWLRRDLLEKKNYKMVNGPVLSDGKGGGLMPVDTNSIVLVRNVVFKADSIKAHASELEKSIKGKAKVGYGPFSVSGSYSDTYKESEKSRITEKGEMSIPHVQIIAIIGTVMPPIPPKK